MSKQKQATNPIILREGMSIGTGNAESDDEFLFKCFVDHPALSDAKNPDSAGMIIAGRTGSGKTAILRGVQHANNHSIEIDPAEMAMDYVANSDALRFVNAIGGDLNLLFQVLWKHVICIEFIRLRYDVKTEQKSKNIFSTIVDRFLGDPRKSKAVDYLAEWEGKFWITMNQNIKEITEDVEKKLAGEFGGELVKFKGGGQYEKRLSKGRKSELVARSRKIINSEQLSTLHGVIDMLAQEARTDHLFFILIDRLDESWVDNSIRFKMIRALVEALKSFRKITNLKILVALRTDVLERVVQETADLSSQREKFEDYFIKMKWSKSDLKRLVDLRLVELFKRQYTGDDIAFDDVFPSTMGGRKTFDWLLERTLLRPRDMIAFVNECITASDGRSEILVSDIRSAEVEFSRKRRDALEQEWRSCLPSLKKILDFFGGFREVSLSLREMSTLALDDLALAIYTAGRVDYDPLYDLAERYVEGADEDKGALIRQVAAELYRVGAVGLKVGTGERLIYSHLDEPLVSPAILTETSVLRLHPMLHAAFRLQSRGSDG
ncbi:hypothetical protein A9995_09065 [Erythrobacter sp. QSSC1-22B]|uniref:P-loop ATPase, Sll1717 family n=1 Tax=Erythrobacter sp. QSSC1-22B TaxID=1860125 RepID=UPI0008055976|nr:hypothetical protein [Erythrobacter sp. QSSC1-22B]OBX19255.1 hypothetical protein A9995_09065 [Erythrobacter sp. QSSC1-22B]